MKEPHYGDLLTDGWQKLENPNWAICTGQWIPDERLVLATGVTGAWRLLIDGQRDLRSRFLAIKT